jgi:hypothetical protein
MRLGFVWCGTVEKASPECLEKKGNSTEFAVAISAPYTPALEVVTGPIPLLAPV